MTLPLPRSVHARLTAEHADLLAFVNDLKANMGGEVRYLAFQGVAYGERGDEGVVPVLVGGE